MGCVGCVDWLGWAESCGWLTLYKLYMQWPAIGLDNIRKQQKEKGWYETAQKVFLIQRVVVPVYSRGAIIDVAVCIEE